MAQESGAGRKCRPGGAGAQNRVNAFTGNAVVHFHLLQFPECLLLMAAKQAVREQALPFHPDMNTGIYGLKAYKLAMQNTNYNKEGRAVISSDDDWAEESEWDDMFEQMKKERGIVNE